MKSKKSSNKVEAIATPTKPQIAEGLEGSSKKKAAKPESSQSGEKSSRNSSKAEKDQSANRSHKHTKPKISPKEMLE